MRKTSNLNFTYEVQRISSVTGLSPMNVASYLFRQLLIQFQKNVADLSKDKLFDETQFSAAIIRDNDTVVIRYLGKVFEATKNDSLTLEDVSNPDADLFGFSFVDPNDDRFAAYSEKLDSARLKVNEMTENRKIMLEKAGKKQVLS